MKTMLSTAYDFLNEKTEAFFEEIWQYVSINMKNLWETRFLDKNINEIKDMLISEFYTLLTFDGKFAKNKQNKWVLIEKYSYDKIKKMKINISETILN